MKDLLEFLTCIRLYGWRSPVRTPITPLELSCLVCGAQRTSTGFLERNRKLENGTAYSPLRPTRLDEIKNFHSLESINTENSDTHGRSVWVHSSRGGFLDNSVRPTGTGGEVGAVGTSVAGNLGAEPHYPVRI